MIMKFLFPQISRVARLQGGLAQVSGNSGFAINAYGIAYSWGLNTGGILGNGNSTSQSSPVAVRGRLFNYIASSNGGGVLGIEAGTGHAYGWGTNASGMLGSSTGANSSSPVSVQGGRSYSQISVGIATVVALEGSTGNAYAWGLATNGVLGNNTTTSNGSPVSVLGGRSYSFIAIDPNNLLVTAIEGSTGNAYCWGVGGNGGTGNNTANSASSPVSVVGGRSYSQLLNCGFNVYAIEGNTGHLYSWGSNGVAGQIGNNTLNGQSSPTSVVGARSYSFVSAGMTSSPTQTVSVLAIEGSTGNAYGWGAGTNGQLGTNTILNASSPTSVVGARSFTQTFALGLTSFAIEGSTGNMYAWGLNGTGNLGTGNLSSQSSPTIVAGARSISAVITAPAISPTGISPVILVKEAGTGQIFGWGTNANLQLAYSNTQNLPVAILGGRSYSNIGSDTQETSALAIEGSTGNMYAWGFNGQGQLGNNTLNNASSPVSVFGGKSFSQAYAAANYIIAVEGSTGLGWGIGSNAVGQLGTGGASASSPVSVSGGKSWSQLYVTSEGGTALTYGIEGSTGSLYGWGSNTTGQLGNYLSAGVNATTPISLAAIFTTAKSFSLISGGTTGSTVFAVEGSTGNAYGWGLGNSGQMGTGNTGTQFAATSVSGGRSFSQIYYSGAGQWTAALEASTGNAYAWGTNNAGNLGNNTSAVNVSSPISVFGGRSFNSIAIGTSTAFAIEGSTGNAYCWGSGTNGQLGNNGAANALSPVSVVGAKSFVQLATNGNSVISIEGSTGNLYGWGLNSSGELGSQLNGNSASSPTSVAALLVTGKSFSLLSGNNFVSASFAIEGSTGNLYTWGVNPSGQLGTGNSTTQFAIASVSGGRSWSQISINNNNSTVAIEANTGNAYAWGNGSSGQLGNNTTGQVSSPVSVFGGRSYNQIVNIGTLVVAIEASTGNAYAWGSSGNGALGFNSAATSSTTPGSVAGARSFTQVVTDSGSTLGIEGSTGNVFAWGTANTGQLGQQLNIANVSSPASVAALITTVKSFSQVVMSALGNTGYAIEGSTGNMYAWGVNAQGQVGNNSVAQVFAQVPVAGARSFSQISQLGSAGHAVAIEASTGNAYAWGLGTGGQLGNNTILNASSPVSVLGGRSFRTVIAASNGTLSIGLEASTGNAYCWGTGTTGQLGNNTILSASSPVSVVGGRSFSQVASDGASTFAIEGNTGHLYSWGINANGQLAINSLANQSSPVSVFGGRSFNQVFTNFAGNFYAIEGSTGNAYAWGSGGTGQLGNNNAINASSPVSVVGARSFKTLFADNSTVGGLEASTGNAYMWGTNSQGQLGANIATATNASSPVSVLGGRSFIQILNNGVNVLALEGSTGNAYAWGQGTNGQLGNGAGISASSPVSVSGARSFKILLSTNSALVSGGLEASTGAVYTWGAASSLLATYNSNLSNIPASAFAIQGLRSFKQIAIVNTTAMAIEGSTGNMYAWGLGTSGQLGNGNAVNMSSPSLVQGGRSYKQFNLTLGTVAAIEGSTGNMYAWGLGTSGQLGNNATNSTSSPVSVVGGRSFIQIADVGGGSVTAIEGSTGNIYAWGSNASGQLGTGSAASQSSPTVVAGGRSYSQVIPNSSSSYAAVEASTGTVFGWGGGGVGQLGNYNLSNQSSPVSVVMIVGMRSFVQVVANASATFSAVEGSTGNVYTWGAGTSGQIGNNAIVSVSSPVIAAGGRSYGQLFGAGSQFMALEASTGNMYGWGNNAFGQLANNNTLVQSSPVSAVGGRSFTKILALTNNTFAIEGSTGLMYSVGNATAGQLGFLGNNTSSAPASSFVAVAGARSIQQMSASADVIMALEASTGFAYTWGIAASGELGAYNVFNQSSPVSVVFITGARSFSQISSNTTSSVALEASTGNLYSWGTGTGGILGTNSVASTSSPVSVVGGRSYSQVQMSANAVAALEASTGFLYTWGTNAQGELGINTILNASSPTLVLGGRSYSQFSNEGINMAAIEGSTGNAYVWGNGTQGQIGNNTNISASSPTLVLGGRSYGQILVNGGQDGTPILNAIEASTGNMYTWGSGGSGQIGNGIVANASSPTSVVGGRSFTTLVPHSDVYSMAVEGSTGLVYMWGKVQNGLLANNLDNFMASPVSIAGIPNNV